MLNKKRLKNLSLIKEKRLDLGLIPTHIEAFREITLESQQNNPKVSNHIEP